MKFEFTKTATVDTEAWSKSNARLEQNLKELVNKNPSEKVVATYLDNMICALEPVNKEQCKGMLFLMYDAPSSMPADARVEYVYKPTYLAAIIMMTAMNRYEGIAKNETIVKATGAVLEATLGRKFRGAGYNDYVGLLDTLQLFAEGDTIEFIKKFHEVNEHFVEEFMNIITFVEDEICSGKITDMWSGKDYICRGKEILGLYHGLEKAKTKYVWYACYGSNMSKERFMRYIRNCTDTTPPVEDQQYWFKHNIYFAKAASIWQNGGKAFLDDTCEGGAYGRAYKITEAQFEEIQEREGADYKKKLYLGVIELVPVYTFTDTQKNTPSRMPSKEYFMTILNGLKECYTGILSEEEMVKYLIGKIFPDATYSVVSAIKKSAHYISNAQISAATGLDLNAVRAATSWLVEYRVIQQDQRSIRAGHRIDDAEAFFFTVEGSCARELVSAMVELTRNRDEK